MPLKDFQKEFIEFAIECNVLSFKDTTLKSGRISPYFFNAGLFNTGLKLQKLGKFYAAALQDSGIEYDILFGPAYKGIPLVCSLSVSLSNDFGIDIPYCFNRKEVKDHGEGGLIVGSQLQGKVVVVDDVITAGTAIRESVKIINATNGTFNGVLIALDRQEKGKDTELSAIQQVENEFGIKVISIIGMHNIIEWMREYPTPDHKEKMVKMKEYRDTWGV